MVPTTLTERLQHNVASLRQRIAEACGRVGREPASVRLVAVTKYAQLDVVRALLGLGVRELGESRAQQLVRRASELGSALHGLDPPGGEPVEAPHWHMIGHLQRNKVKPLLPHARVLHSLDSLRLADELQKQADQHGATIDAFLEVNVAGESQKGGVGLGDAAELAGAVTAMPRIRLCGLMTMPPADPDPEQARPHFARLRELLAGLQREGVVGPTCRHLSMGMTQDYAVAVEEGATFVRVGSALYKGLQRGPQTRLYGVPEIG